MYTTVLDIAVRKSKRSCAAAVLDVHYCVDIAVRKSNSCVDPSSSQLSASETCISLVPLVRLPGLLQRSYNTGVAYLQKHDGTRRCLVPSLKKISRDKSQNNTVYKKSK